MPPILLTLFHYFISPLLIIFNSQEKETEAATQSISNPNSTTTTSLPSPPNKIISRTQSEDSIPSFHDLESGNQSSPIPIPIPIPNNIHIELPEWRRIGKFVQTVSFGGLGVLITLFVNTPASATTHPAIYIAFLTFKCLGVVLSIFLSAYSTIYKGSPTVGLLQKKLICFILFFVVLAWFFHLQIAVPVVVLGLVTVLVLIGLLVIVLYLLLTSRNQHQSSD